MTEEKVMNSPQPRKNTEENEPRSKPTADRPPKDKQTQATTEEFEEEGMGVAPKE
jgi:hypothetical protein